MIDGLKRKPLQRRAGLKLVGFIAGCAAVLAMLYISLVSSNSPLFNAYIAGKILVSLATGERAVCGQNGWIFNRLGMRALLEPWVYASHNARKISVLDQYLKQRGIKLIVVPVPDKASIIQIRPPFNADNIHNQRERMIGMLRNSNVEVIDLSPVFTASAHKDRLYQKKDSHWDGEGILLAAQVIADTLNRLLGASAQSGYTFKDTEIYEPRDLAMLLGDSSLYPNDCRMIRVRDGSLFRDSVWSDIMIFGDSYSGINHAWGGGIGAQVACLTNRQTFTISHIGTNSPGPSELLNFLKNRRKTPKVIIWVFISYLAMRKFT